MAVVLGVALCVSGCKAPAMDDATVRRLVDQGVDPDYIFRAKIPGFTALETSAEPMEGGGFRMTYVSDADPAVRAEFQAHRTALTGCPRTPIPRSDGTPTECADVAKGWYRSDGRHHEYLHALQRGSVRLSAPTNAISADDLLQTLTRSDSLWGPASRP
ncbi:hypothetical protein [Actinocorallia sp. A-T 12471]|uniref:hypothetical protein n=1 Tax=Actinocorallia sp. A-T 12471 TaxID=3089813 RepID=UPI0029D083EA|nr:hypothetical protein [Actinocorallia sp. A-T 12471]MDX6740773.1 hypothetical protein [Actinocorallia sp. A-T 12471]